MLRVLLMLSFRCSWGNLHFGFTRLVLIKLDLLRLHGSVGRLQYVRQSNPDIVFVHLSLPHCDNLITVSQSFPFVSDPTFRVFLFVTLP